MAFWHPPRPQALFWCECPFPEARPLLSFSLQSCSSCDVPGSGQRAPPAFLSPALPLLFLFLVGLASPIVVPRKGLSCWSRGGGPEPRRKPGGKPPAPPGLIRGMAGPPVPASFLEISLSKLVSSCHLTPTVGAGDDFPLPPLISVDPRGGEGGGAEVSFPEASFPEGAAQLEGAALCSRV